MANRWLLVIGLERVWLEGENLTDPSSGQLKWDGSAPWLIELTPLEQKTSFKGRAVAEGRTFEHSSGTTIKIVKIIRGENAKMLTALIFITKGSFLNFIGDIIDMTYAVTQRLLNTEEVIP